MKKDIKLSALLASITTKFKKYSLTMFIVVLVGGLASAVLMLNSALQKASDTSGYTPVTDSSSFDQVTINRVKQLHSSSEQATDYTPPAGRINPFSE